MGPDDIPDVGRFAMVADPGGAPFYVHDAAAARGRAAAGSTRQTPGLVSWHELYSSLGDKAAFDFYSGQFGWETMHEMDMGPMGTYRIFGADGVQMGGMMNKPDNMPASAWGFYVNVDGIDAAVERVKANGGQVLMGPHEVPGGSWIVQAVDPQGANFALVSADAAEGEDDDHATRSPPACGSTSKAEEAAKFYVRYFPDSRIDQVARVARRLSERRRKATS